jgi:hypothetical protein
MIEGFGYSEDAANTLGALYADRAVCPETLADAGARYVRSLLAEQEQKR